MTMAWCYSSVLANSSRSSIENFRVGVPRISSIGFSFVVVRFWTDMFVVNLAAYEEMGFGVELVFPTSKGLGESYSSMAALKLLKSSYLELIIPAMKSPDLCRRDSS